MQIENNKGPGIDPRRVPKVIVAQFNDLLPVDFLHILDLYEALSFRKQ